MYLLLVLVSCRKIKTSSAAAFLLDEGLNMSNDFRLGDQAHERVPKSDSNLGVLIGGFVAMALLCLFIAVKCDDV